MSLLPHRIKKHTINNTTQSTTNTNTTPQAIEQGSTQILDENGCYHIVIPQPQNEKD